MLHFEEASRVPVVYRIGSEVRVPPVLIGFGLLAMFALAATAAQPAAARRRTWRHEIVDRYVEAASLLAVRTPQLIEDITVDNAESDGDCVRYHPHWLAQSVYVELQGRPECLRAGLLFLWAHELTHHHFGDAFNRCSRTIELEQRADFWSGVALARAGVAYRDIECALPLIGRACSPSHGCPEQRLAAIAQGYGFALQLAA